MSFGQITVDFPKSLFFGQPIIDSYLLHEELQMLTIILDEKIEVKLEEIKNDPIVDKILVNYKANLKSGRITHKLMRPEGSKSVANRLKGVKKMYNSTSGRPRIYIDNTVDFLESLDK